MDRTTVAPYSNNRWERWRAWGIRIWQQAQALIAAPIQADEDAAAVTVEAWRLAQRQLVLDAVLQQLDGYSDGDPAPRHLVALMRSDLDTLTPMLWERRWCEVRIVTTTSRATALEQTCLLHPQPPL